jgi:hypothetical protein
MDLRQTFRKLLNSVGCHTSPMEIRVGLSGAERASRLFLPLPVKAIPFLVGFLMDPMSLS